MTSSTQAPIIHHVQLAKQVFHEFRRESRYRNSFSMPAELSIVTAHNYPVPSLLEENLDYLGVKGYDVINKPVSKWSHTHRIWWLREYLSERCTTEFVLVADADDVVLQSDPEQIIRNFLEFDCEVVYCSTHFPNGYKNMPAIKRWADRIHRGRYLNAGVCVGKREYLIKLYDILSGYITKTDVHASEFFRNERFFASDFPKGIGCDQTILRFLEPELFPELKVDAENRLIFRNNNRSWSETFVRTVKRSIPSVVKTPVKRLIGTPS